MRERQQEPGSSGKNTRITPACAGKTVFTPIGKAGAQDHPRVCGKDKDSGEPRKGFLGSPPRVRERLEDNGGGLHLAGITPACAGKTKQDDGSGCIVRDHPRVCGKDVSQ